MAQIESHVAAEHPLEACGLLLGSVDRIEEGRAALNLSPRPDDSFEIDPAALFAALREERAGGLKLIGYYHSHPNGEVTPSDRDLEGAIDAGRLWLILGSEGARLWRSGAQGFTAEDLTTAT